MWSDDVLSILNAAIYVVSKLWVHALADLVQMDQFIQ